MSGHSHWHSIRYKKGIADAKKSKAFSKMSREITIAAREGGGNPEFNTKLRLAIERAKSINMPAENIEKAIKRGTGELTGEKLESITLEAYGPGGIAIIIEGITDNKNRTLAEIRQILNQYNGKLVQEGAVRWLFERKGCVVINLNSQPSELKDKEKIEMIAIEGGAEDFRWRANDLLDVYTKVEELEKVKKYLENKGIKVESASLDWVAKNPLEVKKEEYEEARKLFEELDEHPDVQEIYSNLKD